MMKPLRKAHFHIWLAAAALLPSGILLGWLAVPAGPAYITLPAEPSSLLPRIFSQADRPEYSVSLRTNDNHTAWQLEWINKQSLRTPSLLVCQWPGNSDSLPASFRLDRSVIIGRIEAKGAYRFALDTAIEQIGNRKIVAYDFIHEQVLDTLTLLPTSEIIQP